MRKPTNIKKAEALEMWAETPDNQRVSPEQIPYKHKGTTIAEDGIRICGSKKFILSVMSRLKDVLACECATTRVGIAFSEIADIKTGAVIDGRYRCSIQVHERGQEAKMMNTYLEGIRAKAHS